MGRAKVKMELIAKEKTRNTTYRKRKQGIIKKANEFTILCDVDTVIIIYPPNSDVPEIWPENPNKIKKTICCYKSKKGETRKRTYGLNDFYEDRKKKIEDELIKARKKTMEAKYATWFDELDVLTEVQLRQFAMWLETKENVVRAHLEFRKRNMNFQLPNMLQFQGFGFGLDQGQLLMNRHLMSHDRVLFGDGSMGSFIPMKREPLGFGYPVVDGGMAFDNPNQWVIQPVVHGGVMQDQFANQEYESEVNNGIGEFVMDDHRGRHMGSV